MTHSFAGLGNVRESDCNCCVYECVRVWLPRQRYNESNVIMSLVLFDTAVEHVLRIARLLRRPGGHVLLVGVGGSGKQSLAKLASFVVEYPVTSPKVTPAYGAVDFLEELKELYRRAAIKPATPLVYLISDCHLRDDTLLMYVNDLLSTGLVTDMYSGEELDAVLTLLRSEAKAAGVMDSREAMVCPCVCGILVLLHAVLVVGVRASVALCVC